jgi:hypothetical protein
MNWKELTQEEKDAWTRQFLDAVVLITWARSTGKLPAFFDDIIDQVAGSA